MVITQSLASPFKHYIRRRPAQLPPNSISCKAFPHIFKRHKSSIIDPDDYEEAEVRLVPAHHAIYGPLLGKDLIERFEVFRYIGHHNHNNTTTRGNEDESSSPFLFLNVTIGSKLTGHKGIIHGGIITLLFDEAMVWGYDFMAQDTSLLAVTANLNVDFRSPVHEGTPCRILLFGKTSDGRTRSFEARMESIPSDGSNEEPTVYADASSVFVLKNLPDE